MVVLTPIERETLQVFFTYFTDAQGLSPCDFDLIRKMKERPRGICFRTVPEILQAVDRSYSNYQHNRRC